MCSFILLSDLFLFSYAGVESIILHPEFNRASEYDADLALLSLDTTVALSNFVRPICLPDSAKVQVSDE